MAWDDGGWENPDENQDWTLEEVGFANTTTDKEQNDFAPSPPKNTS
jgi:hypothetical protein